MASAGGLTGERETEATWVEFGVDLPRVDAAAAEIRRALADIEQNGGIGGDQYEADETGVKMVAHRHLIPVSALEPGEKTRLGDLRLLCPNCHRLVHAGGGWLTWDELLAYVR